MIASVVGDDRPGSPRCLDELIELALPHDLTRDDPWLLMIARPAVEILWAQLELVRASGLGRVGAEVEIVTALRSGSRTRGRCPGSTALPVGTLLITGLPRTGTTRLLELLAASAPRLRTLEAYETIDPADPTLTAVHRIEAATERFTAAAAITPKLHQMHPLKATGPAECTPLLQHTMACLQWLVMFGPGDYYDWLSCVDHRPVYDLWRAQLNAIDPTCPSWLLKSPLHLMALDEAITGTEAVVVTRRDVVDQFESFMNLTTAAAGLFAPSLEPRKIARFWLRAWPQILSRATRALERRDPATKAVIVDCHALSTDPDLVLRDLCHRLDIPLPANVRRGRENVPSRPVNWVTLRDLGLDPHTVKVAFGDHLGGPFLTSGSA